jgi:hypothetical protein
MNRLKLANLGFLLLPTLSNLFAFGWYLGNNHGYAKSTLAILAGIIPVHVYALSLGLLHLSQSSVAQHYATTIHEATLLTVTWLCQIVFVMLPDATIARGDNDVFSPLASTTWDMYNIALQPLLLFPALVIVVAVIPRGPELYFPMEKLFTKQLLDSMKEHYAQNEKGSASIPELNDRIANVTPELSSTVLGSILFLYVRFGSRCSCRCNQPRLNVRLSIG